MIRNLIIGCILLIIIVCAIGLSTECSGDVEATYVGNVEIECDEYDHICIIRDIETQTKCFVIWRGALAGTETICFDLESGVPKLPPID